MSFAEVSTAAAASRAVVTASVVNIRSGPGTSYSKIAKAAKGSSLDVLGQKNGWYQLRLPNGKSGWAIAVYLKVLVASVNGTGSSTGNTNGNYAANTGTSKNVVVKADKVNVRSGAGTGFGKLMQAGKGQQFAVVKELNGWYNISLGNGKSGWIAGWLVTVKDTAPNTGAAGGIASGSTPGAPNTGGSTAGGTTTSSAPVNQIASALVVKAGIVNIRSGAGTNFGIVGKVTAGQTLTIANRSGNWYLVRLPNGKQGWIAGWLGTVKYTTPSTGSTSHNAGGSGSGLPASGDNSGGGSTTGSTAPPAKQNGKILVKGDLVNVRSGAGIKYGIVAKVKAGQELTVTGISGDWYQVRLPNNSLGWIAGWLTELRSDVTPSRGDSDPGNPPKTDPGNGGTVPSPSNGQGNSQGDSQGNPPGDNRENPPGDSQGNSQGDGQANPQSTPKLNSIDFQSGENGEELLTIKSEGEIKYNLMSLQNPARMVIDIDNSDIGDLHDLTPGGNLVDAVRVAQYSLTPMTVRVVLDLKKPVAGKPVLDDSNRILTLTLSEPSINGKVIVVDAGHGGYDPGAIGVTGLNEKDVNLDIALRLRDKLTAEGAKVIMTRDGDSFISLDERAAVANTAYADIFVSIHANSSESTSLRGTSTYYYAPSSNPLLYSELEQRQRLARTVQGKLVSLLGTSDIGIRQANFAVLRGTNMPSILVESAFVSNAADEALLKETDFRDKTAQAITEGINEYFAGGS